MLQAGSGEDPGYRRRQQPLSGNLSCDSRCWQRMLEDVEPPLIVDSARKHGIADEDVLHAFNHPVSYEDLDDGFVMIIGPTRSAQLVELGVLDTDHGPVIVHAMTARRRYLR